MNMEEYNSSLVVESSYPDLVINVGKVALGDGDRNMLQETQKEQEKAKVTQAVCALLNSGGGVIRMEMANREEHPVELGLDLEQSLRDLIESLDLQAFFEFRQEGRDFYIFVKSWSSGPFAENSSMKPRICSLSSSLYCRSGTSVLPMDSREAFDFLKKRKAKILEKKSSSEVLNVVPQNLNILDPADLVFQKDHLQHGEILPFPKSQSTEFRQCTEENIQDYVQAIIPQYVSAFANSGGGYLFIGVDDKSRKVLGCAEQNIDYSFLENIVANAIATLPIVHFCSSESGVEYRTKIIDVFKAGELYGYLYVIKVQPFCCAVFSKDPTSWMVNGKDICSLTAKEWVGMMIDPEPELLSDLAEAFESQLSLSHRPPLCRPVYSKKGLEHKVDLQRHLFPVASGHLRYTPKSLWTELSSEHEGLEKLINRQMRPFSQGILIFSRSWAVDLNLHKKEGVICDALLIAQNSPPILYTILRKQEAGGQGYCTRTAFALKQKLVNMGGYTGKVCVKAKVLCLSPQCTTECLAGAVSPIDYPGSYSLGDTQQVEALLQALVIVLLGFRSLLSDQLGCEVLNLLTAQQYALFSTNLRKNRELFVHGLPGSGKTIMAMKIMEKIRNVFHCGADRILYICENQPLRNFVSNKGICQVTTRKAFMKNSFDSKDIQHIIIDEAQNFRTEDGEWYEKAKTITQRVQHYPGILWIFLDYFQTSHLTCCGLPPFSDQNPTAKLTKVVRNADQIAHYLQREMEIIAYNPPRNIPPESLGMLPEAEWTQGIQGSLKIETDLPIQAMFTYVADTCKDHFTKGYSENDVAVLVSTTEEVERYKNDLLRALRKKRIMQLGDACELGDHIVFDSVRRFSGLERSIVFGIHPRTPESAISHNILVCLASRARQHLYILWHGEC
nr:schlafen family member 11-like isoform X2 [Microcebus murinus]XP_012643304.1 schlafen family member 11-like isoform X2 [Microcebus murinus]